MLSAWTTDIIVVNRERLCRPVKALRMELRPHSGAQMCRGHDSFASLHVFACYTQHVAPHVFCRVSCAFGPSFRRTDVGNTMRVVRVFSRFLRVETISLPSRCWLYGEWCEFCRLSCELKPSYCSVDVETLLVSCVFYCISCELRPS